MQHLDTYDATRLAELREAGEFAWIDLADPDAATLREVADGLGIPGFALEDSLEFGQRAKVDDFGDHLLLVLFTVTRVPRDPEVEWRPLEVHLYVSGDWLVTIRRGECPLLDEVRESLAEGRPATEMRALWRVLRALTDAYTPALDELARRTDAQEARVFENVARARLQDLYHLRQETNELLRRAAAQREVWDTAARRLEALEGLEQDRRPLLDDVGDQLAEVAGELERHNSDAATLVQVYFNASGDRLNRVATRLSVLATFFLAWTLVTGFFGQNFGWLVGNIDSRTDFLIWGVGGLLVATLAAAAVVRWFGRSG